jgi:AmmeMemoRadiSam system protein B/AmmeMemoRadiSam system protein A
MDCSTDGPAEWSEADERPELTPEQEAAIFRAACRRVAAAVRSERADSTRRLLDEAADTPVYGAFVTLRRDGRLRSCCGHLGRRLRLAEALDHAADRAATDDPRFPPIERSELSRLDVDVWVLWGPRPVAARGEDRVAAVVIGRHGLQVTRGTARGLLLPGVAVEHHFDARTFLEQVCVKAGLPRDAWKADDTQLSVFEGRAIEGRFEMDWPAERQPAVAGGFYPADPAALQRAVEGLFASGRPAVAPRPCSGIMTPHAGWMYSGALAAATFRRAAIPESAIVLCPKHRPHGPAWSVAPHRRWLFPGGGLDADPPLAERLAAAVPGLELDASAHRAEHAIEVHLPLLAHLAPKVRVVGITVGEVELPELLRFGVGLAVAIRDLPQRPLLVVSSDMNHFADDARTRQLDRLALGAIATLDPEGVYQTVRRNGISMCGMAACVVAMEAMRWLGCLHRCEEVGYATSADAGGPRDRVVGYAGLLFE